MKLLILLCFAFANASTFDVLHRYFRNIKFEHPFVPKHVKEEHNKEGYSSIQEIEAALKKYGDIDPTTIKKLIDKKIALPQIVFATAFDQYAVKAFEVNAIDYILKPFDKKRVNAAVEKARKKIQGVPADTQRLDTLVKLLESQRPQNSKVLLRSAGRLLLVDQKDLCFASIEDGIISVVATNLEGQSNCRTLEELLEGLDPDTFWRAHRSFVVNINRIKEVVPWFKSSYQLRMDDRKQTEIPVSRAQTKRLRELFGL